MLYSYVSSWFILYINSLLFGYLAITWVLDTYFSSRNRFEAFVGALYWSIRTFFLMLLYGKIYGSIH